jgi:hypothetical protein
MHGGKLKARVGHHVPPTGTILMRYVICPGPACIDFLRDGIPSAVPPQSAGW